MYRNVDVRIWNDAKFMNLSNESKLLYLYLLTNPNMTSLGAMRISSIRGLADEIGIDGKKIRGLVREVSEIMDMGVDVDESPKIATFIAMSNFLKYNPPANPNVVRHWPRLMDFLPECPGRDRLFQRMLRYIEGCPESYQKAFEKAFGKALGKSEGQAIENKNKNKNKNKRTTEYIVDRQPIDTPASVPPWKRNPLFASFYEAYPRKEKPARALKAFVAIDPDAATVDAMIAWIEKAKESAQWQDRNYIMHPATFLNARAWEGDPPPPRAENTTNARKRPDFSRVATLVKNQGGGQGAA